MPLRNIIPSFIDIGNFWVAFGCVSKWYSNQRYLNISIVNWSQLCYDEKMNKDHVEMLKWICFGRNKVNEDKNFNRPKKLKTSVLELVDLFLGSSWSMSSKTEIISSDRQKFLSTWNSTAKVMLPNGEFQFGKLYFRL